MSRLKRRVLVDERIDGIPEIEKNTAKKPSGEEFKGSMSLQGKEH